MPVAAGERLFVTVNLARSLQGLLWVRDAPAAVTVASSDLVVAVAGVGGPAPVYPLLVHVDLVWTRGAGALGPAHVLMVWARPRWTWPGGAGQGSVFRWCGCVSVSVGVPVRVDGMLMGRPVVVPGGVVSLLVGVAEVGLCPFVRCRADLTNAVG